MADNRLVEFEGKRYQFPPEATDDDIRDYIVRKRGSAPEGWDPNLVAQSQVNADRDASIRAAGVSGNNIASNPVTQFLRGAGYTLASVPESLSRTAKTIIDFPADAAAYFDNHAFEQAIKSQDFYASKDASPPSPEAISQPIGGESDLPGVERTVLRDLPRDPTHDSIAALQRSKTDLHPGIESQASLDALRKQAISSSETASQTEALTGSYLDPVINATARLTDVYRDPVAAGLPSLSKPVGWEQKPFSWEDALPFGEGDFAKRGITTLAEQFGITAAIAAVSAAHPFLGVTTGYSMEYADAYYTGIDTGLSPDEAAKRALPYAAVAGALEFAGAARLVSPALEPAKNAAKRFAFEQALDEIVKTYGTKKAGAAIVGISKALRRNPLWYSSIEATEGMLFEGFTEGLQQTVQDAVVQGKAISLSDFMMASYLGALGGGGVEATVGIAGKLHSAVQDRGLSKIAAIQETLGDKAVRRTVESGKAPLLAELIKTDFADTSAVSQVLSAMGYQDTPGGLPDVAAMTPKDRVEKLKASDSILGQSLTPFVGHGGLVDDFANGKATVYDLYKEVWNLAQFGHSSRLSDNEQNAVRQSVLSVIDQKLTYHNQSKEEQLPVATALAVYNAITASSDKEGKITLLDLEDNTVDKKVMLARQQLDSKGKLAVTMTGRMLWGIARNAINPNTGKLFASTEEFINHPQGQLIVRTITDQMARQITKIPDTDVINAFIQRPNDVDTMSLVMALGSSERANVSSPLHESAHFMLSRLEPNGPLSQPILSWVNKHLEQVGVFKKKKGENISNEHFKHIKELSDVTAAQRFDKGTPRYSEQEAMDRVRAAQEAVARYLEVYLLVGDQSKTADKESKDAFATLSAEMKRLYMMMQIGDMINVPELGLSTINPKKFISSTHAVPAGMKAVFDHLFFGKGGQKAFSVDSLIASNKEFVTDEADMVRMLEEIDAQDELERAALEEEKRLSDEDQVQPGPKPVEQTIAIPPAQKDATETEQVRPVTQNGPETPPAAPAPVVTNRPTERRIDTPENLVAAVEGGDPINIARSMFENGRFPTLGYLTDRGMSEQQAQLVVRAAYNIFRPSFTSTADKMVFHLEDTLGAIRRDMGERPAAGKERIAWDSERLTKEHDQAVAVLSSLGLEQEIKKPSKSASPQDRVRLKRQNVEKARTISQGYRRIILEKTAEVMSDPNYIPGSSVKVLAPFAQPSGGVDQTLYQSAFVKALLPNTQAVDERGYPVSVFRSVNDTYPLSAVKLDNVSGYRGRSLYFTEIPYNAEEYHENDEGGNTFRVYLDVRKVADFTERTFISTTGNLYQDLNPTLRDIILHMDSIPERSRSANFRRLLTQLDTTHKHLAVSPGSIDSRLNVEVGRSLGIMSGFESLSDAENLNNTLRELGYDAMKEHVHDHTHTNPHWIIWDPKKIVNAITIDLFSPSKDQRFLMSSSARLEPHKYAMPLTVQEQGERYRQGMAQKGVDATLYQDEEALRLYQRGGEKYFPGTSLNRDSVPDSAYMEELEGTYREWEQTKHIPYSELYVQASRLSKDKAVVDAILGKIEDEDHPHLSALDNYTLHVAMITQMTRIKRLVDHASPYGRAELKKLEERFVQARSKVSSQLGYDLGSLAYLVVPDTVARLANAIAGHKKINKSVGIALAQLSPVDLSHFKELKAEDVNEITEFLNNNADLNPYVQRVVEALGKELAGIPAGQKDHRAKLLIAEAQMLISRDKLLEGYITSLIYSSALSAPGSRIRDIKSNMATLLFSSTLGKASGVAVDIALNALRLRDTRTQLAGELRFSPFRGLFAGSKYTTEGKSGLAVAKDILAGAIPWQLYTKNFDLKISRLADAWELEATHGEGVRKAFGTAVAMATRSVVAVDAIVRESAKDLVGRQIEYRLSKMDDVQKIRYIEWQARRNAKLTMGLTKEEHIREYINRALADPTMLIQTGMNDFANEISHQKAPDALSGILLDARNTAEDIQKAVFSHLDPAFQALHLQKPWEVISKIPFTRMAVGMFVATPINLMKYGAERTPLALMAIDPTLGILPLAAGAVNSLTYSPDKGKRFIQKGPDWDRFFANQLAGHLMLLILSWLSEKGWLITPSKNPQEKLWRQSQALSGGVPIPEYGMWVEFAGVRYPVSFDEAPFSWMMVPMINSLAYLASIPEDATQEKKVKAWQQHSTKISQFTERMMPLFGDISRTKQYGYNWSRGMSNMVPFSGFFRDLYAATNTVTTGMNPTQQLPKAEGVLKGTQRALQNLPFIGDSFVTFLGKHVGGFEDGIPNQINYFGETLGRAEILQMPLPKRWFSEVTRPQEFLDLEAEWARLGWYPDVADKKVKLPNGKEITLSDEQHASYNLFVGQQAMLRMTPIIKMNSYARMDDEKKEKLLHKMWTDIRAVARRKVVREYGLGS